jgi:DNA anti-recombination protein RmuC
MEKKSKAVQEVTEKFYQLTVQQRDAAWKEVERLKAKIDRLERNYKLVSDYSVALQRIIEGYCRDGRVNDFLAKESPYLAELLNQCQEAKKSDEDNI